VYTVEVSLCGMIYIPGFMKSATNVGGILKFCHNNLNDCNAGITNKTNKLHGP
jgi:hypothetical protein